MKVVFDMDTGVDDSLALIYALNRLAYEIQAGSRKYHEDPGSGKCAGYPGSYRCQ